MIISNLSRFRNSLALRYKRSDKVVKFSTYSIAMGLVVFLAYSGHSSDSVVVAENQSSIQTSATTVPDRPSVDQLAATDLAAALATTVDLPIASNVSNQAISLSAKSALSQTSDESLSKPQAVPSGIGSTHEVTTYKAKVGDTVAVVASQFGLSADTIKMSNNLSSDALEPGRDLLIPPVDGVIVTAQPGDTPTTLAQKYSADAQRVVLFNDFELSSAIPQGSQIVIPGGRVAVAAPAPVSVVAGGSGSSRATVSTPNYAALASSGNGYDYGYCTWYAFNRRAALGMPISGRWGNASSWASLARADGFAVNSVPSIGAVIQTANAAGGYGHVGVVESINADGSVFISEMNYGGWGVKSTRTIPVGQVGSYNYIH